MNTVTSFLYRHVPSFKREHGGLYRLYATVYSWIYSTRMRHLHDRGLHGRRLYDTGPCQWCGKSVSS